MRKSKKETLDNKDIKEKKNIKIDEKQLSAIEEELNDNKEIKEKKKDKLHFEKRKIIFLNIFIAIMITIYCSLLIIGANRLQEDVFLRILKISSFVILFIALILFEIAMKKDSERIFLNGIEIVSVGGVTLYVLDLYNKQSDKINFIMSIVIGIYVIYYLLKSFIIAIKKKKKEDEN